MNSRERFLLLCIVALGFLLRFFFFLDPSIWGDEGQHFAIANADTLFHMRNIEAQTARDHPFGIYPVLHGWIRLFGSSPAALRFFPVLLSTLAVAATGWAARLITRDSAVTLLAALFMALSPFSIRYGYDITPYCLVNIFAPLSLALMVRCSEGERGPAYPAWILVNAVLLNLHYFAYFLVAAELILSLILDRKSDKWGYAAASAGIYAVASLPILLLMDPAISRTNHSFFMAKATGVFPLVLSLLNYGRPFQVAEAALLIVLSVLFLRRREMPAPRKRAVAVLASVFALTILLVWCARFVFWNALGSERYLMVVFPALILAFAVMIKECAASVKARVAFAGALSACLAGGVVLYQPNESMQDFRGVGRLIAEQSQTSGNANVVVTPACCRWALDYYLDWEAVSAVRLSPDPVRSVKEEGYLESQLRSQGVGNAKRVFLVLYFNMLDQEARLKERLKGVLTYENTAEFNGIRVLIFRPKPEAFRLKL